MKRILVVLALLLIASIPALAANELVGMSVQEFIDDNKEHTVVYHKFTPEEMKIVDKAQGPQPKPGEVGVLVFDNKGVMVVIIRNEIITFNNDIQPKALLDKLLKPGEGI